MKQEIMYRRLTQNDRLSLLELNHSYRNQMIDLDAASTFLSNDNNFIYVALINQTIIAFVYGYILDRLDGKPMAYVHEIGTLDSYRHQSIATNLFQIMKQELFEKGIIKVFLMTQSKNIAACGLYHKSSGEIMIDTDFGLVDRGYVFKPTKK